MERESFEDKEVAAMLNRSFVSVKVDREERPDVDHIYMEVCQALTGQGGWPLTVIMTPDRQPFFAGTYFPKHSKWGRPGLIEILQATSEQWREKRDSFRRYGINLVRSLQKERISESREKLSAQQLDIAYKGLEKYFDGQYGGFSSAPKFPMPHNLLFLLHYWKRTGKEKAIEMVDKTLQMMCKGGIYDHLGFGFCRYSTDNEWLVPHFEKMLYDNALLCYAYTEAYQAGGNPEYARIAEEIITYVLRDMTSPDGAFYSAEDADSQGVEGKFYVWTKEDIIDALGWQQGCIFADYYHVTSEGNFEGGKSILHSIGRDDDYAAKVGMEPQALYQLLASGREKLYWLREQRVHPFKDDKILTSWNALMIAALAKAARVLRKKEYTEAAIRSLAFIETRLMQDDGRLLARYRDGEAAYLAYLDDYAFLLWALLELYETTLDISYIQKARLLAEAMNTLFADRENGGFFFTGSDGEALLIRPKELYDGATPSGNSVAAFALLKLAQITSDEMIAKIVESMFEHFGAEVLEAPRAYTFFLIALNHYLTPPKQIIVAGSGDASDTRSMVELAQERYLPQVALLFYDTERSDAIRSVIPDIGDKITIDGKATAYICDNFACRAPITDLDHFADVLRVM